MTPQVERPDATPSTEATLRRIKQDLHVNGMLRLGDDCVFEGNIAADGGVVLGTNTIVKGNIITRGPVMLGAGSRVEGRVNPVAGEIERPREPVHPETLLERDQSGPNEGEGDLRLSTVETTLDLLLGTAIRGAAEGDTPNDERWWNLERGAAEDIAQGVIELLEETYRDGRKGKWSANEVLDIVVTRALPLAVPMTVQRKDANAATIRINAPTQAVNVERDVWGPAVLSFVSLIGNAAHPGFQLRKLEGIAASGTKLKEHLHAQVRVAEAVATA